MKTVFDYATILATLQQIDFKAHIAGGAVRDTILNKPIHDVDVFIEDALADEAAACLRKEHGYVKVGEWKQYLGFSDPAMTRVAKFEKADETIPVCVIGLVRGCAGLRENISRFDFGVCMAAFDGEETIRTDEFNHDVENRTFTLRRADDEWQFAYSMSRFEKIAAGRYRGWTLAIPDQFKELAKEHTFRQHYYRDHAKGFFGEGILKPKERPGTQHVS